MSNLVYKQDVIKAIEIDCSWDIFDDWGNYTPTGKEIIETINKVPSVDSKRVIKTMKDLLEIFEQFLTNKEMEEAILEGLKEAIEELKNKGLINSKGEQNE